jgi:hypothetical protein
MNVDENSSGFDVMEQWKDTNKIYHFEMSTKNLEKVIQAIGYGDIEEFLSDNPGAQEAIVDWITEWTDRIPEWKESLLSDIPEENEED